MSNPTSYYAHVMFINQDWINVLLLTLFTAENPTYCYTIFRTNEGSSLDTSNYILYNLGNA